jgi:translocation and assembly module TamB
MNEFVARASFKAEWAGELTADFTDAEITRGTDQWRIDPSVGHLRITSSRVVATNLRLTNGVQAINVDGSLLIAGGELTPGDHLTATASNVDIAAIDQFLGLGLGIAGRASATLSLSGRLNDPRGRITLEGTELTVRGYQILEICGAADLAAGGAMINVTVRQPDGVALKAIGRLPLSAVMPAGSLAESVPNPDWDLSLVTEPVDLRILGPFAPRLQNITGEMIADVRIVGAAARPRATGTVAVADGAFVMPAEGIAFSHIDADIGLTPDLITVRRFVAQDKHHHPMTVTGQLAVGEDNPGAFKVNLEADRIGIVDNALGDVEVSALLQLSGDLSHPKLTGNLEVANSRIEIDTLLRVLAGDPLALVAEKNLPPEGVTPVDLRADAARAAAEAANRKPSRFDASSFFSGLEVDVRLIAPDDLILRGSSIRPVARDSWSLGDLNVTVGGELQATRQPGGDPIVVGDITTVRGVYTFEGRRFEIQRGGRIRFNGENPPDPTFDLRGVRTIQGVEARVDVRGRLSDPTLQLGSNLPLDEADILSMIIFNRPVNQLGDTQRADLVGAAAALAGGFVTAPIAQRLSKALDLDLVELETVTFGQNVAPRIRIGQQIGNRLFVQFAQQFGPQSLSELTAEYQLTRFLRLQANSAQGPGSRAQRSLLQRTERFGLDLIFFFNY